MKTRNKPPRAWSDWHVASHLAFVPAVLWAAGRRPVFWELLVLLLPVVVCSTAYHRQREPRGSLIARLDCGFAYVLYAYGLAQAWAAAGAWRAMYVAGAALVALTHVFGILRPASWERTHSWGMHVAPGAWCLAVAVRGAPLFVW